MIASSGKFKTKCIYEVKYADEVNVKQQLQSFHNEQIENK